jgi:hypothetical protein
MMVFVVLYDLVGGQNCQTKVEWKRILGGLKAYLRPPRTIPVAILLLVEIILSISFHVVQIHLACPFFLEHLASPCACSRFLIWEKKSGTTRYKIFCLYPFLIWFFSWPEHTLYPVWTLGFTHVKSKRYLFNVKQTCQQIT